jgi:hypothetical protein
MLSIYPAYPWNGGIRVNIKIGLLMDLPGGSDPTPKPQLFISVEKALKHEGFDFTARAV